MRKIFALTAFLMVENLFGQVPYMVKDFNTSINPYYQTFSNIFEMNGKLYMTGEDSIYNNELWVSDGTEQGTQLLKDINAGRAASNPFAFNVIENNFYFFADDGTGTDLWKSDGTQSGTVKLKEINTSESDNQRPNRMTSVGSKLYFLTNEDNTLWVSDGNPSGTMIIKDSLGRFNTNFLSGGNKLFFLNNGNLYVSDGTRAGTQYVSTPTGFANYVFFKDQLYFSTTAYNNRTKLWKTDGSTGGTVIVKDSFYVNSKLLAGSDYIYFSGGKTDVYNIELWKSDGTGEGTVLVKEIMPGSSGSNPHAFAALNNYIYFHATDSAYTNSLWRTDGTAEGTIKLEHWQYTNYNYYTSDFMKVNKDFLYFLHADSLGVELWKSDGSISGASMVKDIYPGPRSPFQYNTTFTSLNDNIYFLANDGSAKGTCLWKSDGTSAGTNLLKYNMSHNQGSGIGNIRKGSELYFTTYDYNSGYILWRSDGTAEATLRVRSFNTGGTISNLTVADSIAYFSLSRGLDSTEFWKSDGTPQGTVMVRKFLSAQRCGKGGCHYVDGILSIKAADKKIYIIACDSSNGQAALFVSDGSESGTNKLCKAGAQMAVMNGLLYFIWAHPSMGYELAKTDGTMAGTSIVKDILSGKESALGGNLTVINGVLYFIAYHPSYGAEPWRSDGTAEGTWMIRDINTTTFYNNQMGSYPKSFTKYKNHIFFIADDGINGSELWMTDGKQPGATMVKNIDNTADHSVGFSYGLLSTLTGLYFVANDRIHGPELWRSDGTVTGTKMVKDIAPGAGGSAGSYAVALDSVIYFTAWSPETGEELWCSDGTESGTRIVSDINAGVPYSYVHDLTYYNKSLYFSASDGVHGEELWRLDIPYSYNPVVDSVETPVDSAAVVTALTDTDENGEFPRIFPNPNNGNFTVQLDKSRPENYSISIMNSMGFNINTIPFKTSDHEICFDMSAESSGIYYLQVDYNGARTTKRIIKH